MIDAPENPAPTDAFGQPQSQIQCAPLRLYGYMASGKTDPKNSTGIVKRRRRLGRSCDACFQRKIKCDYQKPKCDWCSHQGLPCTFLRNEALTIRRGDDKDRDSPLTPMSTAPQNDEIPLSNLHSRALAKSESVINRQIQFAGGNIGSICAFNGMPLFSKGGRDWIKACSGEDLDLDSCFDTQSPGPHSFNLAIDNGFQHYESLPLPSLGFLRQQIEMFQSSLVALFFPVIDTALFEDTIKAAYYQQPSTISLSVNSAKACIFAFCAMTSVFIHELQDSSLDIAKDYTRQAYQMLSQILCEPPTIDGLQTFLLLCFTLQALSGDHFIVDNVLSSASRFVLHFKGHINPAFQTEKPTPLEIHIRRLFWITYTGDKALCLAIGRVPSFEDSHCDLIPPLSAVDMNSDNSNIGNPIPGTYFHTTAQLSFIHSRIYRNIYSLGALRQPEADLLREIRDLDYLLDEWKESIPSIERPSLARNRGNNLPEVDIRTALFQVQYHHCMVMVHQASSRCTSWVQNQDTSEMGSSLAISVNASRSLLGKCLDSQLDLRSYNMLFSLSYFIQAIISLFCNTLSNPLNANAEEDMRLVSTVPRLIDQIHRSSRLHSPRVYFVEKLALEFERIARCAMSKAYRESI